MGMERRQNASLPSLGYSDRSGMWVLRRVEDAYIRMILRLFLHIPCRQKSASFAFEYAIDFCGRVVIAFEVIGINRSCQEIWKWTESYLQLQHYAYPPLFSRQIRMRISNHPALPVSILDIGWNPIRAFFTASENTLSETAESSDMPYVATGAAADKEFIDTRYVPTDRTRFFNSSTHPLLHI